MLFGGIDRVDLDLGEGEMRGGEWKEKGRGVASLRILQPP